MTKQNAPAGDVAGIIKHEDMLEGAALEHARKHIRDYLAAQVRYEAERYAGSERTQNWLELIRAMVALQVFSNLEMRTSKIGHITHLWRNVPIIAWIPYIVAQDADNYKKYLS